MDARLRSYEWLATSGREAEWGKMSVFLKLHDNKAHKTAFTRYKASHCLDCLVQINKQHCLLYEFRDR